MTHENTVGTRPSPLCNLAIYPYFDSPPPDPANAAAYRPSSGLAKVPRVLGQRELGLYAMRLARTWNELVNERDPTQAGKQVNIAFCEHQKTSPSVPASDHGASARVSRPLPK